MAASISSYFFSNFGIAVHRGAFCQFPFRWIYYYGSNKFTGKETEKMHLCAMVGRCYENHNVF